MFENQILKYMRSVNLTVFGNLSYTARRVSPVGLKGGQS